MEFLWTAFLIGLLGSFHCVGMCGPIALALPGNFSNSASLVTSRLLYNSGRVLTYTLLGIIFGLFGKAVAIAGLQQSLSIGIGIVLIVMALFSLNMESRFFSLQPLQMATGKIKFWLGKLFKVNSQSSLFTIGILNGLLPCGFVYIGLLGAIAAGGSLEGGLYMLFFGLGTFPLMFATSMLGPVISLKKRNFFKKMVPVFIAFFAVLFILRGMNLGIPYLSPRMGTSVEEVRCH